MNITNFIKNQRHYPFLKSQYTKKCCYCISVLPDVDSAAEDGYDPSDHVPNGKQVHVYAIMQPI